MSTRVHSCFDPKQQIDAFMQIRTVASMAPTDAALTAFSGMVVVRLRSARMPSDCTPASNLCSCIVVTMSGMASTLGSATLLCGNKGTRTSEAHRKC